MTYVCHFVCLPHPAALLFSCLSGCPPALLSFCAHVPFYVPYSGFSSCCCVVYFASVPFAPFLYVCACLPYSRLRLPGNAGVQRPKKKFVYQSSDSNFRPFSVDGSACGSAGAIDNPPPPPPPGVRQPKKHSIAVVYGELKATFGTHLVWAAVQQVKTMYCDS